MKCEKIQFHVPSTSLSQALVSKHAQSSPFLPTTPYLAHTHLTNTESCEDKPTFHTPQVLGLFKNSTPSCPLCLITCLVESHLIQLETHFKERQC